MSVSLEIKSPTGESCTACAKDAQCDLQSSLTQAVEHADQMAENTAIHPDHTGWGVIQLTCFGFVQKEI